MKKKLLLIAACAMALNAPVQAKMSHKAQTIAALSAAGLGLLSMGVTGKYWYDNAQKLENANLSAVERQELNTALSNYKAIFAASSVATVGAAAYAMSQGCAWKDENKREAKEKRRKAKVVKKERNRRNLYRKLPGGAGYMNGTLEEEWQRLVKRKKELHNLEKQHDRSASKHWKKWTIHRAYDMAKIAKKTNGYTRFKGLSMYEKYLMLLEFNHGRKVHVDIVEIERLRNLDDKK